MAEGRLRGRVFRCIFCTPTMLTESSTVKRQIAPCFLSVTQARDATGSQLVLLDHNHDREHNSSQ